MFRSHNKCINSVTFTFLFMIEASKLFAVFFFLFFQLFVLSHHKLSGLICDLLKMSTNGQVNQTNSWFSFFFFYQTVSELVLNGIICVVADSKMRYLGSVALIACDFQSADGLTVQVMFH